MNRGYCVDPSREMFENLLPPLALADLSSLWIWPMGNRFTGEELKAITDSFVGRGMAIWKSNAYWKAAMENLRHMPDAQRRLEEFGPFGHCQQLVERSISRCAIRDSSVDSVNDSVFSGAAWVNVNQLALSADPFRGWGLGSHSAIAFLPFEGSQSQAWARLLQSYGLQGLAIRSLKEESSTRDQKVKLAEWNLEFLARIVSVCASVDIIASLVCQDVDMKAALVFWGRKCEFQEVAPRLSEYFPNIDPIEIERWVKRGARFVLSM
jgi:hypothetical protein